MEITRRPYCTCGYCLRGNVQDMDIRHVLKNIRYIGRLRITGGEPSLNTGCDMHLPCHRPVPDTINISGSI